MRGPGRDPITIPDSQAKLGYLAGLLDGEGHITITAAFCKGKSRNESHSLVVAITNTDAGIMNWLCSELGGRCTQRSRQRPQWAHCYDWSIYADNAYRVLRALLPMLVAKREQAMLAIRFREVGNRAGNTKAAIPADMLAARRAIKEEMNALNRRGRRMAS